MLETLRCTYTSVNFADFVPEKLGPPECGLVKMPNYLARPKSVEEVLRPEYALVKFADRFPKTFVLVELGETRRVEMPTELVQLAK
jgi:hypothetical protein